MIEVEASGFLSIIVDDGRYGLAHIGVPSSCALDRLACVMGRFLVESPENATVLEVMGNDLQLRFHEEMAFAVTGAKVRASLDDTPVRPWSAVHAKKGSCLRVAEVVEGLRYYVSFSGAIDVDSVMGSSTTNLECAFGGYHGRPLMKGDRIGLRDLRIPVEFGFIPDRLIPSMREPHIVRVIGGPEAGHFEPASVRFLASRKDAVVFTAASRLNRTGIRLEGNPFAFRDDVEQSIVWEGILPGTIQVLPDGLPTISLAERTIGGYARIAMVADVDMDRLAHVKPRDRVLLSSIDIEDACRLWMARRDAISFYCRKQ